MSRPNAPWYREARDSWFVKLDGKLVNLKVKGRGAEGAAWVAVQRLIEARPPKPTPAESPIVLGPSGNLSTRDAAEQFFAAAVVSLKPKTVTRYRFDVGAFLAAPDSKSKQPFGDLPIGAVTADHIRQWVAAISGGSTTKAIMLRSVSAFFGWLVKEEKLELNPVRKVKRPKTASRSDQVLISDRDHAALLDAATSQFREVLMVLHGTGCRPGEVQGITSESFNPESRTVLITEHKTDHTGKPRVVFLTPDLTELLNRKKAQFPNGSLLRSRKGVPWSARSILEAMRKLREKTGVRAIAYGYRHGFITDGLKNGVSNAKMAALVGHTSTAVIDKFYSHLGAAGDTLKEALKFREQPNEKSPPQPKPGGENKAA